MTKRTNRKKSRKMSTDAVILDLEKSGGQSAESLSQRCLEQALRNAADLYYNTSERTMSDATFDVARDILQKRFPESKYLREVGAPVSPDSKTKLPFGMYSLDKVKPGEPELSKWIAKHKGPYVISDKLDGASCMLVYERTKNGYIVKMFRRGTGEVGADISHFIPYFVPPELRKAPPEELRANKSIAIRGEVIISKTNFAAFSEEFKDARGMVSGVINRRMMDGRTVAKTDFVAYEVVYPRLTKTSQMKVLTEAGFPVVNFTVAKNLTESDLITFYATRRRVSSYQIDGLVVEDDGPHKLPSGGNPLTAVAFKMQLDQAVKVKVIEVFWDTSKDGRLVPRVQYNPAVVNGVTLQFATGYNAKFIVENGIGPGAEIKVIRSGDVIPRIASITRPVEPSMPSVPFKWNATKVDIYIADIEEDDDVKIRRLVKFFSDMDIENIGRGTVARLYECGLTSLSDYLTATRNTFMSLPGVQATMADKLYTNIQTHIKKVPVVKVMAASNIFGQGVGQRVLGPVVEKVSDLLRNPDRYDDRALYAALKGLEGIQQKTADKIVDGFPRFLRFLKEHPQITVVLPTKKNAAKQPLSGQVFVITGFRDKELQKIIEDLGGDVSSSVSKKTTVLVTKDPHSTSGKTQQARDMAIKIMTKDQLEIYLAQID